MSLRIFADTHISKTIAQQLRLREIDVLRLEEAAALPDNADDDQILNYAVKHQRAVLSLDSDFADLHTQWLQREQTHCGIFLGNRELQGVQGIGTIVRCLAGYQDLISEGVGTAEDLYNRLIWIR